MYDQIIQSLIEIWQNFYQNQPNNNGQNFFYGIPFLKPGVPCPDINPDNCSLLIIGLNPSYSVNAWSTILNAAGNEQNNGDYSDELNDLIDQANNNLTQDNLNEYFSYPPAGLTNQMMQELAALEVISTNNYNYFNRFRELAQHIYGNENPSWCHIDLFYYRVTKQSALINIQEQYPDFFNSQLEITQQVINWLNPEIILVANGYARSVFKRLFSDNENEFNNNYPLIDQIGTYLVPINGNDIPVFFSGMLSGQRSLDIGSFERLKWHMNAVVNE